MSSETFTSDKKFETYAGATRAGDPVATPEIGEWAHRMSYEALHDLGLSNEEIDAYLSRFCSAAHAPRREQGVTDPRPSRETVKDEPFFGGGDWHWGVRPSRPDFWE
jgi:hypothetical protein